MDKRVFVELSENNNMMSIQDYDREVGPALMKETFAGGLAASPTLSSPDNTTAFASQSFRSSRHFLSTTVNEEEIASLLNDQNIAAVWEDPILQPTHLKTAATKKFDPAVAIGTSKDVASLLKCHEFWDDGIRGQNVAIAICDTGVDKNLFPVIDGWTPEGASSWGEHNDEPGGWHGNMVAHSALLAAPDAKILDVGVLKYSNLDRGAWLSDALKGINWIVNWVQENPKYRVVINNSWSTYRRLPNDLDPNVKTYADSRKHPFNERIEVIAENGVPILFAAGNCGNPNPDLRCGSKDIGPNVSIWGAASLDSVLSVAAVDVNKRRLPYSSQGNGSIDIEKPDFSCYFQFKGFMPDVDPGTSTAAPVLAGCVALLVSKFPEISPTAIYHVLKASCSESPSWSPDFGFGILGSLSLKTISDTVF